MNNQNSINSDKKNKVKRKKYKACEIKGLFKSVEGSRHKRKG